MLLEEAAGDVLESDDCPGMLVTSLQGTADGMKGLDRHGTVTITRYLGPVGSFYLDEQSPA